MQVILPFFALLVVLGAWSAWRRSPLYSVKATLQLSGIVLLLIACVVGATLGIVSPPVNRSPVTMAVLATVSVLVLAAGGSATIIRITDGPVAQWTPAMQLVTIHRRRIHRWIWRVAVFLVIAAGAALLLPADWAWLPATLGGFVLVICGPLLTTLYMRARRFDFALSALTADPWTHWQYPASQWESWAKNELESERSQVRKFQWRQDWRRLRIPLLIFAGAALIFVDGSMGEKLGVFLGYAALVVVMVRYAPWLNTKACERRFRRLLAAPPEAWFGSPGLFWAGEFSPWVLSGQYLVEATSENHPPAHLMLAFQSFRGTASLLLVKRIPIPEDCSSDLALLQQKLRESCPKAAIDLAP